MEHLIDLRQFKKEDFLKLIKKASQFKKGPRVPFFLSENVSVANLFLEASTRTRLSFEMAENALGLRALNISAEESSLKKGESLYDTLKTFEAMGIAMAVIRTTDEATTLEDLTKNLNIKLVNAGSGKTGHPSQALLDLYTISEHFGKIEDLKISFVGDIPHSRVVASHLEMWQTLGTDIRLCPIENDESLGRLSDKYTVSQIDEIIEDSDIVYLLRVQGERHANGWAMTNEQYHEVYGLTETRYQRLKEGAVVMHPGPFIREKEIASSILEKENLLIQKQVENGKWMRMAIIDELLGGKASESLSNS